MAANVEETRALLRARRPRAPGLRGRPRGAGRGRAADLRRDGARPADASAPTICASSRSGAGSGCGTGKLLHRPRVPVLDLGDPVPVRAVRVRTREGRDRLARDQRQHRRAVDARHRVRAAARPRERGGRRRRPPVGVRARRHGRAHRDDGRRRARGRAARSAATPRSIGSSPAVVARPASARRRRGAPGAARAVERRPQAHVPALCDAPTSRRVPRPRSRPTAAWARASRSTSPSATAVRARPARGRRAAVPHRDHGAEPVHRRHGSASRHRRVQGDRRRPCAHRGVLPDRARPVARARGQAHHDDRRELPAVPPARERTGTTSRRRAPTARSRRWPSASPSSPT